MSPEGKEKIGESMVRIGAMTPNQVQEVLRVQREKYEYDKLFGEIAVELQFVDEGTIEGFFEET